jgi:hypothetical protein
MRNAAGLAMTRRPSRSVLIFPVDGEVEADLEELLSPLLELVAERFDVADRCLEDRVPHLARRLLLHEFRLQPRKLVAELLEHRCRRLRLDIDGDLQHPVHIDDR